MVLSKKSELGGDHAGLHLCQLEGGPVNQILNNPNLTQEQKTEAVKQVQEVLAVKEGQKKSKILLFAGIGIAVILGVVFIMSGKKGSK